MMLTTKVNMKEELVHEQPMPKARRSSHEAVLRWFSSQKRGTVLDIPAGYGHLSLRLHEMGFIPTCAEIQPEIIRTGGLKTIYSDLNNRIEAPDASFDYVACVEGLEHMTNPYQAAKEISRTLKDGGYAVFSLPNYTNLEARLQFFLTGSVLLPVSDESLKACRGNLWELHNSPLTITILELLLKNAGLYIKELHHDKLKQKLRVFSPFIKLLTITLRLLAKGLQQKYRLDLTLHPEVVLGGNCVIIITQKRCI